MKELFIGLMSGTSVNSIDSVLVDLSDEKIEILEQCSTEIKKELKKKILEAVKTERIINQEISALDHEVAKGFAEAVLSLLVKSSIGSSEILAIGSHGQTIKHSPHSINPYSLQVGNPQTISQITGIKTVADFRTSDIKAGGEGAPFAPLFHQFIFKHQNLTEAVVINIGGISNLTYLSKSRGGVIGYDCGPGNCLIDAWTRDNNKGDYDEKGAWASSGKPNLELLNLMTRDTFFHIKHPKSTGPDYFNLNWVYKKISLLKKAPSKKDVQATLTELTAQTIFLEIKKLNALKKKIYICGGGIHNNFLIQRIENKIQNKTFSTSSLGVDPDYMEAACFAWLAQQRIKKNTFDLSKITGSKGKVSLGEIWDPN